MKFDYAIYKKSFSKEKLFLYINLIKYYLFFKLGKGAGTVFGPSSFVY